MEAGCSVERFLQRENETNRELAGMEPEGQREFGSRVEDTARTPNFWNLSRGMVEGSGQGRSRSYCFWKLLCDLSAALAWACVRYRRRLQDRDRRARVDKCEGLFLF